MLRYLFAAALALLGADAAHAAGPPLFGYVAWCDPLVQGNCAKPNADGSINIGTGTGVAGPAVPVQSYVAICDPTNTLNCLKPNADGSINAAAGGTGVVGITSPPLVSGNGVVATGAATIANPAVGVNFPLGTGTVGNMTMSHGSGLGQQSLYYKGFMSGTCDGTITLAGFGADCAIGQDIIVNDNVSANGFSPAVLQVVDYIGNNVATVGGRGIVNIFFDVLGGTGDSGVDNPAYGGLSIIALAQGNVGGTGSGANARGSVFAGVLSPRLQGSATFYGQAVAEEIDMQTAASSSVNQKIGVQFVNTASDTVHGSLNVDFAYGMGGGAPSGITGVDCGYCFGTYNGYNDVVSTGTLIGTIGHGGGVGSGAMGTVAHGMDLSQYAYTSDSIKVPGFSVDPSGNNTALSQISSGGTFQSTAASMLLANNAGGTMGQFITNGTPGASTNYWQFQSTNAGGGAVILDTVGADANVSFQMVTKGTSSIIDFGAGGTQRDFRVASTGSDVDWFQVNGGVTGAPGVVSASAAGSDTNIDLSIAPKGSGLLKYGTNITATGASTATFLTNGVGGTNGPVTATQNGWVRMKDSSGANMWLPEWH